MEIRKNENSFIQITNPATVSGVYGKNPVVGKFTTDTLEDLSIITTNGIAIFKGTGGSNPTLESVFTLTTNSFTKSYLAQINKHYGPYAIIHNEVSDRDDIVAQYGNAIYIFKNNNNNTTPSTPETIISFSEFLSDFKVADLDNDGYNDIIAITQYQDDLLTFGRILVFLNNNGTIITTPVYNNSGINLINSVEVADFNKDGWNDFVFDRSSDSISLFINNKSSGLFSNVATESFRYESAPTPFFLIPPIVARKIVAADLYNKGGIGVILAGWPDASVIYNFEMIIRINATTIDANPAPPYLFESNVLAGSVYHPKLLLYNRGDRDFLKYRIYKMNWQTYYYYLFDSTTSNHYIDETESLLYINVEPENPPPDNLFYYAVAVDNSYKVSATSDTISYIGYVCPTCWGEAGPRAALGITENEIPKSYSVTNYPNPFNPVSKIFFDIPKEGNVKITVYNSIGQKITELVNEFKSPGRYQVEFNGSNFASGIYFYRIESGNFNQVRKMLLLK
ncbi:MAG: T9SS type A sorting domain-containing protein [Ignavibacteria bacterium]|nr:T9SS type A sorting domain-containing protein [Ignavibacteria bacterium]